MMELPFQECEHPMDSLQEQVVGLTERVDTLYSAIEQLSEKISEVLSEVGSSVGGSSNRQISHHGFGRSYYPTHREPMPSMEHKDILSDSTLSDVENQGGERSLSAEVQIQRLTAQLTAAYNRIAALEEQLLSNRMHV
jgi:chaperonin cofactor prefoldin